MIVLMSHTRLLTFPRSRESNPQTLRPGVPLTTNSFKVLMCFAIPTLLACSLAAQSRTLNPSADNLVESRSPLVPDCAGMAAPNQGSAAKGAIDPADLDRSVSPCD